ncbi:hypothetical protein MRB53_000659 [Persea americana]|uniref:Uncharacterized protein n=1 Tax=Persea americana TaxID=3435 RepID=A0ACC2MPG1_PERAE|nr:hypothetical protein MRB53_000659 [Persea americana]
MIGVGGPSVFADGIGSAPVKDHDPVRLQLWQLTMPSTTTSTSDAYEACVVSNAVKANRSNKVDRKQSFWNAMFFCR